MFQLTRPNAAAIDAKIAAASRLGWNEPRFLDCRGDVGSTSLPTGFVRDRSESALGQGPNVFAEAKAAFARWVMFDLGWTRVANLQAPIRLGEIVAVEVFALSLWSVNLSRIVDVVDEPERFRFVYATTPLHAEEGEERFLLTLASRTGEVRYELEAVSRPHAWLARLGYPVTRSFQHRFARNSHARMRTEMAR